MKTSKHLHPLFRRWTHIRQSCLNPNYPDYKDFLTADGLDDFAYFAEWIEHSIGLPPTPQHKLNRIDQTKGWIMGNVRWTDAKGVGRNLQGHNIWVELQGEQVCLMDIADRYNIKYGTVASRHKRGWTPEEIISVEPRLGNKVKKRNRNESRYPQNT